MTNTKYYPVGLNIRGKKCMVIGAGRIAQRKVKRLLGYGARVSVISPESTLALKKLAKERKISLKSKSVKLKDLKGAYLVISATENGKVNSLIYSYCRKKNILFNVVDSPKQCTFILPSVLTRGNLNISISTGGISPALSKKLRQDLEKMFGNEYAKFLSIMKTLRPKVIKEIKDPKTRKAFFKKAVDLGLLNILKRNKGSKAKQRLQRLLKK